MCCQSRLHGGGRKEKPNQGPHNFSESREQADHGSSSSLEAPDEEG